MPSKRKTRNAVKEEREKARLRTQKCRQKQPAHKRQIAAARSRRTVRILRSIERDVTGQAAARAADLKQKQERLKARLEKLEKALAKSDPGEKLAEAEDLVGDQEALRFHEAYKRARMNATQFQQVCGYTLDGFAKLYGRVEKILANTNLRGGRRVVSNHKPLNKRRRSVIHDSVWCGFDNIRRTLCFHSCLVA